MKILARRLDGFAHEIETGDGHALLSDEPTAAGGTDRGPSPVRLLASSLAACTAITVEMYAARKGWELGEVAVDVDVELADDDVTPAAFAVSLRIGADLDEDQRQRILRIASRCPVHRVLTAEAKVTVAERLEAA